VGSEIESAGTDAAPGAETGEPRPLRILLIDNYDSFTYNLVHQIAATAGRIPDVVHNDWAEWDPSVLDRCDAVVLSPGPGDPRVPEDFGICADAIRIADTPSAPRCGAPRNRGTAGPPRSRTTARGPSRGSLRLSRWSAITRS